MEKKLNVKATLEAIKNSGVPMDQEKLEIRIQKEDGQQFLIESAEYCGVEPVYED